MSVRRLESLDFLKGLAVIFMMIQHFSVWFIDSSWIDGPGLVFKYPFYMIMNAAGGYSAPAFVIIAGMGSWFFLKKSQDHSRIVRRGLLVLAAAYLLNLACPVWFDPASFYVLHLIGFMMIVVPLLARVPRKGQLLLIVMIVIAAVLAQNFFNVPIPSGNTKMNRMVAPWGALRIALASGHFPVLPWSALYILGFYCAPLVAAQKRFSIVMVALFNLLAMGLLGLASLFINSKGDFLERALYIPMSFYPLMPVMFFLLAGGVLLTVAIVLARESKHPFSPRNPVVCLGRISLTVFLVHIVVFKQLLSMTPYYRKIPFVPAFAAAYVIIALFALGATYWSTHNYRFGLEWLLRKVD